jgi:uncharacterized membrane protein YeaQ/YmgE (transglycosylase-associated protein family)
LNTLLPPLLYLIIGVVAGWAAGRFMRGNGFGLAADLMVGVIGAFAAGYGYTRTAALSGGLIGSVVIALLGALVLLFVVRVFARRRGGRRVWS